uniref:NADH-ubiquinone oxidoreductase chain 5 n=2 Tax=Galaxea TaxID=46744 RepID=A0AA51RM14_9CNID|nr:NADH dehydrogenase subunit 5 [Galaxea fascicularis]YP_010953608.1 NADH dehydrogenase subunit 5 [Galaxea astreata]YP_010953621.1 NADH dehydrogenase subunit 5 [Galaxea paucisepta]AML60335.1 NADH dehydrogenase subunit 5 [Galaxea fascicularis]WMQ77780.1 NADH dehydrogenase subunit 5 [Galaxea astreata]WMQ77793.1 NADH dehydrogenase subunit 5 [Galaxea astreata]WMQ77806.1 NADH dehydrogenase subunit 5 [Galaxea paucisepta]WMQ77819.1 NADH dehydrogenase subunit 5 [Galaxea paucisepta]
MYTCILFLLVGGALAAGVGGRKLGEKGAGVLTSSCLIISLSWSVLVFYEIILSFSTTHIKLWRWLDSDLLTVYFGLQFDSLVAIMLLVITTISTLVHIFSMAYMAGDPHIPRFMSYLSLFTFLMVILVSSDNYLQLFIGWEGVGLCSYLLINFWLTRVEANKAAIKAMLVNRVGDMGLILAMFGILDRFGSLEFSSVFNMVVVSAQSSDITLICLLLFIGAVGKSAQLGLHTWLPDAMEGPTPVSALIHAATMVTAGVFLLIRSSPFFEQAPFALMAVTIVGSLTVLLAATVGVIQNDLKKVVAYSTCSQLGYMVVACGISHYSISLFHLMNHAFFKALLFLSAGSVIHALSDEQDIRKMGGLIKLIPLTYIMVVIGSLSLMGFPYLTGFYSKDLILELAFEQYYLTFAYWLGGFSALLTTLYSIRLVYLTFLSNTNSRKAVFRRIHEGSWNLVLPLILLALGSLFVGYLVKEVAWSFQITFPPIVPVFIKLLPVFLSLGGAGLVIVLYFYSVHFFGVPSSMGRIGYTFLYSAWQFNYVFNNFLVKRAWKGGHQISYRTIDKGTLELVGPKGISDFLVWLTRGLSNLQSGQVFNYALVIFIGVAIFIWGVV